MTSAKQAAYEVLNAHLKNANPWWGVRVQPLTIASADLQKPYVVFSEASNMRRLSAPPIKMAEVLIAVKGVALEMATATGIEDAITGLLDDSGDQDVSPRLPFNADWRILTVTEQRSIWVEEKFSGAQSLYHAGHQYLFLMERRA